MNFNSEKNENPTKSIYQKNNFYLLSSWNYGSYSPCNPYYKTFIKKKKQNMNTNPNKPINKAKSNEKITQKKITEVNFQNQVKRRPLKEEERIVTNEYLKSFNYYKKMQNLMSKGAFRPKSVTRIKITKINNNNNNNNIINSERDNIQSKKLKTENNENKQQLQKQRVKLTFNEWLKVKDKQREYCNIIIKKHKEEEKKKKIENKKIEIKYNKIKNQKIKEWLQKKNIESIIKKEIEKRIEDYKEEEKKQKLERKEEIMNNWFKSQAEKMEKEIIEKKRKKNKEKEEKNLKLKKIQEKQIKGKEAFRIWKENKDNEMRIKKKKENIMKKKEEEQKRKEYLKKRVKSFIIGPYTDAAALREIQNNLMENNLNDESNIES